MVTLQIIYSRPYSFLSGEIALSILAATAVTSSLVYGHQARMPFILWMSFYIFQIANVLIDPKICIRTTKDEDGTAVRVRRPLIGFKRCEMEVVDGEDYGGVRNGRAFIRL